MNSLVYKAQRVRRPGDTLEGGQLASRLQVVTVPHGVAVGMAGAVLGSVWGQHACTRGCREPSMGEREAAHPEDRPLPS